MLHSNGDHIEVQTEGNAGAAIDIPTDRQAEVEKLLRQNGFQFITSEGVRIGAKQVTSIINFIQGTDTDRVQQVLDSIM